MSVNTLLNTYFYVFLYSQILNVGELALNNLLNIALDFNSILVEIRDR